LDWVTKLKGFFIPSKNGSSPKIKGWLVLQSLVPILSPSFFFNSSYLTLGKMIAYEKIYVFASALANTATDPLITN
jgi:hypothetical protein